MVGCKFEQQVAVAIIDLTAKQAVGRLLDVDADQVAFGLHGYFFLFSISHNRTPCKPSLVVMAVVQ